MEPNIDLAKTRDFGEVISDTFQFIRQNLKPLLKSFFVFCGFFILATAAVSFLQQYKLMAVYSRVSDGGQPTFASSLSDMWITYTMTFVLLFLTVTAVSVTVLSFLALYKEKGNIAPDTDEMWGYFKYFFLRIFWANLLTTILMIIGFVICLLPGFYLLPVLSLILPIMIFENSSFGYAFNRSFQLINANWWVTFGTIVVVWIIAYVLRIVITLPATAIGVASVWLRPQHMPQLSVATIALSVALQAISQILYIVPTVTIGICYFNLAEHKEGTSLLNRISKFGTDSTQTNLPTEEY